jgi:hypothetical protein
MDKGALVNGWQKQCLIPDTDAPPGTLEVSRPRLSSVVLPKETGR